jgi:hypothetical protein
VPFSCGDRVRRRGGREVGICARGVRCGGGITRGVDGSINLWAYTLSTKQKQHLAGPGLAARIDDEDFALDGDHIAWVEYLPGGDTSSIVLYEFGTGGTRRLRGSNEDMTWDLAPFIQGDWLVWEGGLEDERSVWAVDPVVFAYQISTSGPIKIVRWRDKVTEPYGDEYRSMDNRPVVYNGKVSWRFTRPGGNFFSGTGGGVAIMDLNTKVVDWSWDIPDGQRLGSYSLWSGNLLFTLNTPYDAPPFQSSLWLRPAGAAEPSAVQAPSAAVVALADMKNGLMAWTSGSNVLSGKIGGATTQVATDGAAAAANNITKGVTPGKLRALHLDYPGPGDHDDRTCGGEPFADDPHRSRARLRAEHPQLRRYTLAQPA